MDNDLLKRRIIGAAVLVGLAVIFIPMILSGGRDEMPMFGSNIPDKPRNIEKLRSIEIPKPALTEQPEEIRLPVDEKFPAAKIEEENSGKAEQQAKENRLSNAVKKLTNRKKEGPKVWAVQVGSFSNRNNALALRKKLRQKKFTAFVEYVKNNKGGVYRVRIGPEANRDKADAILKDVAQKLDLKGVVVKHP